MVQPEIEYYGYLTAASGLGVAARGYVKALKVGGYKITCHDLTPLGERHIPLLEATKPKKKTNKNQSIIRILHVNAEELPRILRIVATESIRHIYQIAIWAWETENFPDKWINRFDLIDEIWTGSTFMATAIRKKTQLPVRVIPHVVEVPDKLPAEYHPSDHAFTFFFSFDYKSVAERKNPLAIINVFKRTFSKNESVHLYIKSSHQTLNPCYASKIKESALGFPITIMDGIISSEEHWLLIRDCDAYVSLHRSEGFGLGMAEAMAIGKPVMATAYGGNCDYMNEGNAALVRYNLIKSSVDYPPYPANTSWAEIDVESAIEKMRRLYVDSSWRELLQKNAQNYMNKNHTPEAVSLHITQRLTELKQKAYYRKRQPTLASKKSETTLLFWKLLRNSWFLLLYVVPNNYQNQLQKIRRIFTK
ncbi:glycosyltransferase family 4 protein [Acidithiobacillus thiooxidans]|uniref:glycosyltransferase family 4 protein n=1 Tax=Acidithiobacillus thiooxidans TaxID=930 RepID=UPI000262543E|nr:glycosyltransferase family 4 protein [Acidithiobacillus thiooxidans]MBU2810444.1 glycosyltransferase family 4 protein [Acidithiobacillus thiooxidans]